MSYGLHIRQQFNLVIGQAVLTFAAIHWVTYLFLAKSNSGIGENVNVLHLDLCIHFDTTSFAQFKQW